MFMQMIGSNATDQWLNVRRVDIREQFWHADLLISLADLGGCVNDLFDFIVDFLDLFRSRQTCLQYLLLEQSDGVAGLTHCLYLVT